MLIIHPSKQLLPYLQRAAAVATIPATVRKEGLTSGTAVKSVPAAAVVAAGAAAETAAVIVAAMATVGAIATTALEVQGVMVGMDLDLMVARTLCGFRWVREIFLHTILAEE
jgi:hypothetical protein